MLVFVCATPIDWYCRSNMLKSRSTPPKKLSTAQQALLMLHKIHARGTFLVVNVLLLLMVLYTSYRFPAKFVRVQGEYVTSL